MKLAVLTTIALLTTTGVASAYSPSTIDSVQAQQRHRIEHGRQMGQLTRHEYWRLRAEQAHIAAMERRAKADGYLSAREFRLIRHAQRVAGRHVYMQTHDDQVASRRSGRRYR